MADLFADFGGGENLDRFCGEEDFLFGHGPMVLIKWLNVVGWPVKYVSPNIFSHFGYSFADFSDSGLTLAKLVHPNDLSRVTKEVDSYIGSKAPFFEQEYRLLRADGVYRWVHTHTVMRWKNPVEVEYFLGYLFDITNRKRIEEELDRERLLLKSLIKTAPDLIWLKDPDGVYLLCNPAFERFFGAPETEIIGKTDFDFVDSDLASFFRKKDMEAIAAGRPTSNTEWITFAVDGRRALLETVKTPMRDSSGSLIGVLGIARDITSMNQAKERLEQSERMLKMAMDLAKMASWSYDRKSNLFYFDDHFYSLYGVSSDEVGGHQMTPEDYVNRFIPSDEKKEVAEIIASGAAEDTPSGAREYHHRIVRGDGEERHIVVRLDFLRDDSGRNIGAYGANQDITQQKLAEEKIKKQSLFLRALIDTLPIPFYYKGRDRRYKDCNKAFEKFFGLRRDEFVGKNVFDFAPQDVASMYDEKDTELFENPGEQVYQATVRDAKGEEREVIFHKATFLEADGQIGGILVVITDVSELKRMERELRDLNLNLEKRALEETEKRMANERLLIQQSKIAALGEMIGAIAHQWRQPLNVTGLCIQNLLRAYSSSVSERGFFSETLERAMEQVRYMSKTIDDFRKFFMPDKERAVFSICETIRDVIRLCEVRLAANDIYLETHCPGMVSETAAGVATGSEEFFVEGFRNEFGHAVLNIVNNAIDSIIQRKTRHDAGGQYKGMISIFGSSEDDLIRLTISDNGAGINEEIKSRIFEPYVTTKDSVGTGIGLYFSRIIIEDHMKGKLIAESDGNGAVFTISLPKAALDGIPK